MKYGEETERGKCVPVQLLDGHPGDGRQQKRGSRLPSPKRKADMKMVPPCSRRDLATEGSCGTHNSAGADKRLQHWSDEG